MSKMTYDCNKSVQLSKNFNAKEFKCKGKGHIHNTIIYTELIDKLQGFMNAYGLTKGIISSGYRCKDHDKKVGGSGSGQHTVGNACDIRFYKGNTAVPSKNICCWAVDYGFNGVAYIDSNYTHLDVRTSGKYRGDERKGRSNNVPNGDFYAYFGISKGDGKTYSGTFPTIPSRGYFKKNDKGTQVKNLQKFLNWALNEKLDVDGIAGNKTINAVKNFQKAVGIKADGLFGKDSLTKAKAYSK